MNDAMQTLLRSLLKIGAGYLISKGIIDDSHAEEAIAAVLGAVAIVWGLFHRSGPKAGAGVGLILLFVVPIGLAAGCAFNRQYARTTSTNPTNGVVTTTIAKSTTIAAGDAKATIEKTRASAGKTSSVGAQGIGEEATTSNIASNVNAVANLLEKLK
jgi:hypothetical protein